MYNNDIYLNRANSIPLLEDMLSNQKSTHSDKYMLIYLDCCNEVFDVLNDRIHTMAKDGIMLGRKGSNISIIKTDFSPSEVRNRLKMGDGSEADILVMSFYYDGYAGWLDSEKTELIKYIFGG